MAKYNGHKNWNHWNVSLWINNDESLFILATVCVSSTSTRRDAAEMFLDHEYIHHGKTPDGAPYTISSIIAAMRGL